MKTSRVFNEIPLGSIKPAGWLKQYLINQRDGITGHLEHAGFPFSKEAWSSPNFSDQYDVDMQDTWWPYEQNGYWIDGMVRCGYLLGDGTLIEKAKRHLENVINHPAPDGYLGPEKLREPGQTNQWVYAVFFRALMAYYSATGDNKVIPALTRHYLSGVSTYTSEREVCNVEQILWTYEKSGDQRLLELAVSAYDGFCNELPNSDNTLENMLGCHRASEHGVTFNETAKLGAILYIYTGDRRYLDATVNAYKKLECHSMMVDGVCSSNESLGGRDALESHETCDIADFSYSAGYLLQATGDVQYADWIERACLNAAPGAVDGRFKALQYFPSPNQAVADQTSNHNIYARGSKHMSFQILPGAPCCTGNISRIMPNYIMNMFMEDGQGGIAAVLFGACNLTAKVGADQREVAITEETEYPFRDTIRFRFNAEAPVRFPFQLRIPGWCDSASVKINGTIADASPKAGTFFLLDRMFSPGDIVELKLPMKVKVSRWPEDGIALERGPLVYALRIEEKWQREMNEIQSSDEFPAWNVYAASPWNYALCINESALEHDVQIIEREMNYNPWTIDSAPVEMLVPARTVKFWAIQENDSIVSYAFTDGKFELLTLSERCKLTPPLPKANELKYRLGDTLETIRLVPYGCSKLRITIFPNGYGHKFNKKVWLAQ